MNMSTRQQAFTVQYRMTSQCNAHCAYCLNAFNRGERMSEADFQHSIRFLIEQYLPTLISTSTPIELEYVGGEISVLPFDQFQRCVDYARGQFRAAGYRYQDGCQSNFVGNPLVLKKIWALFKGNVTTTVDSFSDQRQLFGSADRYRSRFSRNIAQVCSQSQTHAPKGVVFVIDKKTIEFAQEEALIAMKKGYSIGLYPAYQAVNPVEMVDPETLGDVLIAIADKWILQSNTPIEPLAHLLRMVVTNDVQWAGKGDSCPFCHQCATRSICVETNGDLYVCMDLSQTKHYRIGNALTNSFDLDVIRTLNQRPIRLSTNCRNCRFVQFCKGGCLNHALQNGMDINSPAYFCKTWKKLLTHFEEVIQSQGAYRVATWLSQQEKAKFYC